MDEYPSVSVDAAMYWLQVRQLDMASFEQIGAYDHAQNRCFLERDQIGVVSRDLAGHRCRAFGRLVS
jgi:hypothetical protein